MMGGDQAYRREIPNRGHALTIDDGWSEVADTALAFLGRFV
jgi:non-heme chloroperoxidase